MRKATQDSLHPKGGGMGWGQSRPTAKRSSLAAPALTLPRFGGGESIFE